jgi:hypothetical protein
MGDIKLKVLKSRSNSDLWVIYRNIFFHILVCSHAKQAKNMHKIIDYPGKYRAVRLITSTEEVQQM